MVATMPKMLALFQRSKLANGSLGDNCGVVSLSPLDWLASASGSKRAAWAAYFLSKGFAAKVLGANICPHERLRVVRDGHDAAAGLRLVVGQVLPQVLGVGAVELREGQRPAWFGRRRRERRRCGEGCCP